MEIERKVYYENLFEENREELINLIKTYKIISVGEVIRYERPTIKTFDNGYFIDI